jgi:hypothetical protein
VATATESHGQSTNVLMGSFSAAGGFVAGNLKSGVVVSPWIWHKDTLY